MRYLLAIALILLLCAGSTLYFYWDHGSALWLSIFVVFLERTLWRALYRLCWFVVFLPLLSDRTRHAYERMIAEARGACFAYLRHATILWRHSPWPMRAIFATFAALCSGLCAFVLLIIPVRVGKIPFVGGWLRGTGVPYLMRAAAARGIELNLPPAWSSVPTRIRRRVRKPYMRLWWWTATRLVRTRQALGRRALRRMKKDRHQS